MACLWLLTHYPRARHAVTRSQTVIVAAGIVLLGCIIGALVLRNQYAAISKTDMLGVVPGMTRDQMEKLVTARKWVCAAAADSASVECNTNAGPLTIAFAPGPGVTPVSSARVRLINPEKLPLDVTATDISAQYGRTSQRISATKIGWTLPGGMSLVLEQSDALLLTLSENAAPPPAPR
jgi:hypothetical protein